MGPRLQRVFQPPTFTHRKNPIPLNLKIEEIPIEKFDLSLAGMRIINPGCVSRIQNSMHLHGQLQPVVAHLNEGKYQVIDGIKRVYAAIELMMETLECHVLDVDLKQAKLLVLSYNRPHQSMEVWEEALILDDLLRRHDLSQQSLSRLTGYSRSWVSRRLSLISRLDAQLVSEIRMGVLNGTQARALIKLPRGNQMEVARVITSWGFSSRQSNALVDAFLEAEDQDQQRYILAHPEVALSDREPDLSYDIDIDDPRLSRYGNDLIKSTRYVFSMIKHLLSCLDKRQVVALKETEKKIITPQLEKVQGYAEKLTKVIDDLQIHENKLSRAR